MKKLLFVLFVLGLFLAPLQALAHDESYFYGTWAEFHDTKSGGASLTIFKLTPDHKVFFLTQSFNSDEPGSGRTYVGSWSVSNDTITIKVGENSTIKGYILGNGFFAEKVYGGYILYGKLPEYSEDDATYGPASLDMLSSGGVVIPAGKYTVGEDIPAGNYRFEMENAQSYIYIYKNADSSYHMASFSIDGATPIYAKQPLAEGNILEIKGRAVRISYARSLFE
ncbi:MAG: hypothetical protein IKP72_17225 [Clostridia bacterium]|nr:hypothetical protein [Clostridia bacterium]